MNPINITIPRMKLSFLNTNQAIINIPWQWRLFQSYDSIIAFMDTDRKVYLNQDTYRSSSTTSKYLNIFLWVDSKQFKKNLSNWDYFIIDFDNVS